MFVIFSLGYYIRGTGTSQRVFGSIRESFGFEVGGTYSLTATNIQIPKLMMGLITDTEYAKLDVLSLKPSNCTEDDHPTISNISQIFNIENKSQIIQLTGTIDKKDVYNIFFYGCYNKSFSLSYDHFMKNPNSYIDYRYTPLFTMEPVVLGIMVLIFVIWLVNWFMNFSVQIYIHYMFTGTFGAFILSAIGYLAFIFIAKNYQTPIFGYIIFFSAAIVKYIVLLATILMASKGWCILVDTVRYCEFATSFIYSACAIVAFTIVAYTNFTLLVQSIIIIIGLIFFILYMYSLITSINKLNLMILAHMMVIQQYGIDPTTTPLQQKKRMYRLFNILLLSVTVLILIYLVVSMFVDTTFWIADSMKSVIEIYFMLGILFIFHIRSTDSDGYTKINDSQDPGEEFALADIEAAQQGDGPITPGKGIQWKPGMRLPTKPQIVETPKQISLETPDGVEEIEIAPGSYNDKA